MKASIEVASVLAGRYRVDRLIGRGAVAEVWRGHDLARDWPVAVKLFAPQMADPSVRARFASEARIAARVVHVNVVSVFDVGEHDGRPFLVMELLSGRSLAAEVAERGPLPVDEVRRLLGQAAAGLDAAHRAGVVHRDVKPANLHLTDDGLLKVVDFGIARLAGEEMGRLTVVGTVVGTAAYLSPEQILGRGGDAAADLYALGCVAYELLCGRPPFTGIPTELIYQHLSQAPVPPRQLRPDVPPDVEALVLAMLAKEPADRPASAALVPQSLSSPRPSPEPGGTALLDLPVQVEPNRPPSRWRGARLYVVLVAAVVVLAGTAWLATRSGPVEPSAAPTPSPVTPSPSATPTSAKPSPTANPVASAPLAWLISLDRALAAQQRRRGIAADVARDVQRLVAEARKDLAESKAEEARRQVVELTKRLAQARRDGNLADGPLVTFLARSGIQLPPLVIPQDQTKGKHKKKHK